MKPGTLLRSAIDLVAWDSGWMQTNRWIDASRDEKDVHVAKGQYMLVIGSTKTLDNYTVYLVAACGGTVWLDLDVLSEERWTTWLAHA